MDKKIKTYLDRFASSGKRPNSFLFFGAGEGEKIEAAFYFVQKISGKIGDDGFLERAKEGIHPDIIIVEPEIIEDKKGRIREKEIVIGKMREVRERLKYFPYELKHKFCVIKKAQKLNAEASNSLLKILEEPTVSTFFILLANDIDSVLPTIASRCAVLRFAETSLPAWREENRERLRKIFCEEIHNRFNYAEKISKDRNEAVGILKDWESVLAEGLRNLVDRGNLEKLSSMADLLCENREAINRIEYSNANPRTILENLFLGLQWK